jgi:hypothetical protein
VTDHRDSGQNAGEGTFWLKSSVFLALFARYLKKAVTAVAGAGTPRDHTVRPPP